MKISQSELKKFLYYNPESGNFTWLSTLSKRKRVGRVAGSHDKEGYIQIVIRKNTYRAHRLAFLYMNGVLPDGEVDHINRVKDDNRWRNLRVVTRIENARNRNLQKNNKTGIAGVGFYKKCNAWRSQISVRGKKIYLGLFEDFFEACCARKSAEIAHGFYDMDGRKLADTCERRAKRETS